MSAEENVKILNTALKNELVAIFQYVAHSKILDNLGIAKLAKKEYETAFEEWHHINILSARILFLDGKIETPTLDEVNLADNVADIIKNDLQAEKDGLAFLQKSILAPSIKNDTGTEELLRGMLKEEEEHIDWLTKQLELIRQIGITNYIVENS